MVARIARHPGQAHPHRPGTIIIAVLILLLPAGLAAETRVQTTLESMTSLWWTGDELAMLGTTRGSVDFRPAPHQMVQARLQLRLTVMELDGTTIGMPEVPRAYVRFRFPVSDTYNLRFTAGQDRLSWGIGSLYNAGDLLFGADGRAAAGSD